MSDCDQSSEGEDKVTKTRKRKKSNKSSNKKIKTKNEEEVQDEVAEEKNKVDVDALWAGKSSHLK